MDIEAQVFTEDDFKKALLQLLPPGEYWQLEGESLTLEQTLAAVAKELKTTADEIKLSVLYQFEKDQLGWRVVDFQSILDAAGKGGLVSDDPNTPNIIDVLIDQSDGFLPVMLQIENHRLPHTAIRWRFESGLGLYGHIRPVIYQRLTMIEVS